MRQCVQHVLIENTVLVGTRLDVHSRRLAAFPMVVNVY